jgi:hypothetical protein
MSDILAILLAAIATKFAGPSAIRHRFCIAMQQYHNFRFRSEQRKSCSAWA